MDASQGPAEIYTRTERIWLADGVVHCVVLPTPTYTLADAEENSRVVASLGGGRPIGMLLDTRASRGIDRDARQYFARPEAARLIAALAMLTDSRTGRIYGNFFMRVNRPPFPVRLFNAEAEAIEWLKATVG